MIFVSKRPIGNVVDGTVSVVVVVAGELNLVVNIWLTLADVEDLESTSLAAGSKVDVT